MGETQAAFASSVCLEASVSFGRFETDSLSWEKWSCFSPNKYLEEVDKCATPGSVAQKKAYFEAHYKKIIAARKTEWTFHQVKQANNLGSIRSACPDSGNSVGDKGGVSCQFDLLETRNSGENAIENEEVSGKICKNPDGMKEGTEEYRLEHCPGQSKRGGISPVEEVQEVPIGSPEVPVEEPKKDLETETRISPKIPDENPKLNLQKKTQKTNPVKYEDTNAARNLPGTSTAKAMKPTLLKSSTRSRSAPSLNRSKNLSEIEKKRTVFPKSLHMSISLGAAQKSSTPPPSFTQTRKSLIMEKVREKDIERRALKSFQNSIGHSKSILEDRSPLQKPAPSMATEPSASASVAIRKDSGRPLKAGAAVQQAPRSVGTASFGSGNNEKEERRKEFQKKLGRKSDSKDAEGARPLSKSKEEKEVDIQRPRKNLNFKATPLPSFYRGLSKSKSSIRQDGHKSGIRK